MDAEGLWEGLFDGGVRVVGGLGNTRPGCGGLRFDTSFDALSLVIRPENDEFRPGAFFEVLSVVAGIFRRRRVRPPPFCNDRTGAVSCRIGLRFHFSGGACS